jgi:hypothetical protein
MASEPAVDRQVPFRWPVAWTDPKLLSLFQGGPVNCLIFEQPPPLAVAEAARAAEMAVHQWNTLQAAPIAEAKWNSSAPVMAITDVAWPRLRPLARSGGDQAISGPTGVPWIDSTSWVARLAISRSPSAQIWLDFGPPPDLTPTESAYRLAIADCSATSARWMIQLDKTLAAGLASGNETAMKTWGGMKETLSFFEQRHAWRSYVHDGPLGVISTFAGTNEFMGTEVLNLAARRNLLYRVIDLSAAPTANLEGLTAVLWLDPERPSSSLASKLSGFVKDGGLLIIQRAGALALKLGDSVDCPVSGYEMRKLGKGLVASPVQNWEDPYWVALDAHSLVSKRNDPIRMFNSSSIWVHYSVAPRGANSLIQLVNFAGRPTSASSFSIRIQKRHRSVAIHSLESGGPAPLKPVAVDNTVEYYLPAFSVYAALEVTA